MNELKIISNEYAKEHFQNLVDKSQDAAFIEEMNSLDGETVFTLVIENLPEIMSSLTALIAVLRAKKISFKIFKNEKEIESIGEEE